ncbi:unnamed protein product [Calicophoron daubneyi]|uniref:Coiled-coil domain-containing protein 132 n=1 Tax=Calicophoron daubneyi TaxID=300641 RepID=A0AAV2T3Q3_CALDB
MDKIIRLVKQPKTASSTHGQSSKSPPAKHVIDNERDLAAIDDFVEGKDLSCFSRDPHMIQETLDGVEDDYYSMTFDSGKYEIEHSAGPTCRELAKLKLRLLLLDKQNKAVSRRVSELVLEKHPRYEAELKGVLLLQSDNWETLQLCRRIRKFLKISEDALILPRLTVLQNYRRRLRLNKTLHILHQIRTLQTSVLQLDILLNQRNFHAAIELHRESLVVLEDYRQYRCIEPIHIKLKAFGLRIDDLLDTELQHSCEHFSEESYATVQQAFELLGSTQTTFAQLQMHYISAIQRSSLSIVQSLVLKTESTDQTPVSQSYADLCSKIPLDSLPSCLMAVCQRLWIILLCYHRTLVWHENRACGKRVRNPTILPTKQKEHKLKMFSKSLNSRGTRRSSAAEETSEEENDTDEDLNGSCQPQLIRQWHDYVAGKLRSSRGRIWTEVSGRIEPILEALSETATDMTFDQIASVLRTVNHLVNIGEEFAGNLATDLPEVLRNAIYKFFKDFHRKHLERLKMFLENETWELCPVKASFSVLDLQEYRTILSLFKNSDSSDRQNSTSGHNLAVIGKTKSGSRNPCEERKKVFQPPYVLRQFDVSPDLFDDLEEDQRAESSPDAHDNVLTSPKQEKLRSNYARPLQRATSSPAPGSDADAKRIKGSIFSNTTLEVLRLIGRYLQMMLLLQPIAGEVMHCICQVFDYYLFSIFIFFGPVNSMDSADLPERLRLTLRRISERLIAPEDHPSVLKGDRFPLPEHEPMHVFNSISKFADTTDQKPDESIRSLSMSYLKAHFVGVESAICLADTLETVLLPHLSKCLPERKRGLTLVFREQSLAAAKQLREPCAAEIVPHLLSILMPSPSDGHAEPTGQTNAGQAIAATFSKIWLISGNTPANPSEKDTNVAQGNKTSPRLQAHVDLGDFSNMFVPHVTSINWTKKEVATVPSPYVNELHTSVFIPFASGLQAVVQRLGLSETSKIVMWNTLLTCIAGYLLNAYGSIQQCSEEGRGQMLVDVQFMANLAETDSKIRPFPKLDHVIEYIQAFYIPVHEWEHWLTRSGTKYTRAQLTGLAHCIARGDRRQRQRLLNTINQIYSAPGLSSAGLGNNGLLTTASN